MIKPKGDARYIRPDAKGHIKESDNVGRSLKKDREKKAGPGGRLTRSRLHRLRWNLRKLRALGRGYLATAGFRTSAGNSFKLLTT